VTKEETAGIFSNQMLERPALLARSPNILFERPKCKKLPLFPALASSQVFCWRFGYWNQQVFVLFTDIFVTN
jgi:hypothetical protein